MIFYHQSSSAASQSQRPLPKVDFCQLIILNVLLILCNVNMLSGLKCVCDPKDCELIRQSDCPGKGLTVWDACKCCKVCAKVEGETCGGAGGFSGICETPLKCITKPPIVGTGICLELPSISADSGSHNLIKSRIDKHCQETIKIQPGCEIVDRKCECFHQTILVCTENFIRWDFANIEECELNLLNLYKSEVEFDEDYTMPPTKFELAKPSRKRRKKNLRKTVESKQQQQ